MSKTIITIIIATIVIVGIAFGVYYLTPTSIPEEENGEVVPTDEVSTLLENLKQETGIDFSDIKDIEFDWHTKKDDQTVQGKGFEANRISDGELTSISTFFTNKGFEVDVYNVTAGTIAWMTGYKLASSDTEQTVCHFIAGATGYKEATGQWIPPEPDLKDVEVKCGKTEIPDETAGWQDYTNEKYGYSLKYPSPCLFGPLPGECKQEPPEQRPQECRCYFNAENPDEVSLGTFTGPKDSLTGASFSVSHYDTDPYNPPADTDLIEWLKEKFPYQEIPDEINMDLDGTPAVKVYTPASPMAFSQEDIYFIKDDKLFKISILDVDNQDNRELYDQIFSTFKFSIISKEQALIIAQESSDCSMAGVLTDEINYNAITKTWWIDLERMPELEKDGCNPACVVNEETKTAEVNWRCTGLIVD